MSDSGNHNPLSPERRRFITDTVKLAVLGTLIIPIEEACNNRKSAGPTDNQGKGKNSGKTSTHPSKKRPRNKWSHEGLVMNSKTKIMHLPSSKVYKYYDEIIPKHLAIVSMAAWESQLQEPVRLNKEKSGTILEIIALEHLQAGIRDDLLAQSMSTLSRAFDKDCEQKNGINPNTMNFRIHELMLQLVALNNSIPADSKWEAFNNKVKKPEQLRKRQKWMETQSSFNERVKYILDRKNDYIARLTKRASQYSYT